MNGRDTESKERTDMEKGESLGTEDTRGLDGQETFFSVKRNTKFLVPVRDYTLASSERTGGCYIRNQRDIHLNHISREGPTSSLTMNTLNV